MKPILTILLLFSFYLSFGQSSTGCADTSYRMRFSSPGKEFRFYTHCNTADGGTVLVGNIVNIADSTYDLAVVKVSATGGIIWKSHFPNLQNILISRVLEQSNGEVALLGYIVGTASPFSKIIVIKFSANGNLLWCNHYYLNSHYDGDDDLHSYSLSEGLNNDLLFTFKGSHYADNNSIFDDDSSYAIINRITNAGTLQWSKAFVSLSDNNKTNPSGVFLQNGEVYSFGYSDYVNSVCNMGMGSLYAMRLNYNTGNLIQLKTYCHYEPTTSSYLGFGSPERTQFNAVKLFSNRFSLFGRFSGYDQYAYSYQILLDEQLNIVRATQYKIPYSISFFNGAKITVLPDGTAHLNGSLGTSPRLFWATFDSANRIIRQRKLTVQNSSTPLFGSMSFAYKNISTYNFSTNYNFNGNRYSLFTQIQNNDPVIDSCLGSDTAFASSNPIGYTASSWSWKAILDNPVVSSPVILTPADFIIQTEPLCTQISRCDSLRIAGPDTLCVTNNFIAFTGTKNADCRKRVLWEMNTTLIDSSYQPNDSTLNIRFKPVQTAMPQTLTLYASAANCVVAKDTAQIVLLPGMHLLPSDTVVCSAVNIRLTPGKWGKAYLWQDGSTDSVFIATDTGRYTVQVQTACGTVFKDTFNVTRPAFSLGADKTVCAGDTVTLRAPAGFVAYQWSEGGNITGNSQVLKVSPAANTQYIARAQTGSGCTLSDTITVAVWQPPLINLGEDTTFCTGDSLHLSAPPSFASYQWSNGSTAAETYVKSSGPYWMKAKDGNGCSSADTITVLPLYPKPVVMLLPKGVVCLGQSDTLRAPGNFTQYQWQDGSTANFLSVAATGNYWLRVTGAHGCTGSDTAVITKLAAPPARFLPKDTTICAGESIQLRPAQAFNRYLWSNGASSPFIDVTAAGLYRLRVTDNDNCSGSDSITLALKDCPNKIFFPSAFSPNGDGRNDVLKPFVEGRLLNYSFTVYNRWGGIAFTTTDYRKGWNGMVGGLPQATGAFVWLCRYQFTGEEKKAAKGTVLLIR